MRRSLLVLLTLCPTVGAADPVEIRLSADKPPAVEVAGLTPSQVNRLAGLKPDAGEWAKVLRVTVADGKDAADRPAVLGAYRLTGDRLRFEPRFPLVPGLKYRAAFDPSSFPGGSTSEIAVELAVPKPAAGRPTAVERVYPTADRLPENALRFYIQFSAPMSRGDVYRHVALLAADGRPVLPSPFLEITEELWSADGTRFTLFLNPGRVKRGLVPREEDGPALEAGKRYALVVSRDWPDADGRPLRAEFRKEFAVGPIDDDPIDVGQWSISPPNGPANALVVRLPKPLDRALLQRMVWVTDDAGKPVEGALSVGGGERVLSFAPDRPWAVGSYRLVVDTRLEDPCGNRVGEPFEVDETKPAKPREPTATRAFAVR